MDSLLTPVLILVLVAACVLLVVRAWSRRSQRARPKAAPQPAPDPVELAREAAGRLSEEQHRRLYALIAQGQAMAAIKVYLEATGEGLRASRDAVTALAAHPQPFRPPEAAPEATPDDDDVPQRFSYRYRAIASKGDVTREVSSNMLNDEIYGRIRTLAKSGDTEAAATALTRHSDISMKQAREFIALLDD
jgi:DNA-binding GntR family transcriptional regulator